MSRDILQTDGDLVISCAWSFDASWSRVTINKSYRCHKKQKGQFPHRLTCTNCLNLSILFSPYGLRPSLTEHHPVSWKHRALSLLSATVFISKVKDLCDSKRNQSMSYWFRDCASLPHHSGQLSVFEMHPEHHSSAPRSLASSALCEPLIPTPICMIWGICAQQQTLNLTWLGVYNFKEQGIVQPEIHKMSQLCWSVLTGRAFRWIWLFSSQGSVLRAPIWFSEVRARTERLHCHVNPFSYAHPCFCSLCLFF